MPVDKLLIKEENEFFIQLYKDNVKDLYLTSGNYYCFDIHNDFNIVNDNNIDIIVKNIERYDLKFNNIYLDSNYIAPQQASLFKYPIIKIWNGKYLKDYRNFRCYNYIDDLKYYVEGVKTFYLLNDNNITPELLNYDIKIIEANITKLTKELETLLFAKELYNFKTLDWNDYRHSINYKNCYVHECLTIDVHSLDIIPCTGLNKIQYTLGHIYDNEIVVTHTGIATKLVSDKRKTSSFCDICPFALTCTLSCYNKVFYQCEDPFLINENQCQYNLEKANYLAYVYDVIGVRKKAIEMNDFEIVKFINENINRR